MNYDLNDVLDNCPKCQRYYDEIDHDYQICSKCGWDENTKEFGEPAEPTKADYIAGRCDFNGFWV